MEMEGDREMVFKLGSLKAMASRKPTYCPGCMLGPQLEKPLIPISSSPSIPTSPFFTHRAITNSENKTSC